MKVLRTWWGKILAYHDTEPMELYGGFLKIGIGLWLLLPFHTWESSPTFYVMAVFPEWLWGLALILLGSAHVLAVKSGNIRNRQAGSAIGSVIWFSLSCMFLIANPPAIGWVMFMSAAVAQGWCYVRLSDAKRKRCS